MNRWLAHGRDQATNNEHKHLNTSHCVLILRDQ